MNERDRKVQQIEEKLNSEVKIANKRLKRLLKRENEYKSMNSKKDSSCASRPLDSTVFRQSASKNSPFSKTLKHLNSERVNFMKPNISIIPVGVQ